MAKAQKKTTRETRKPKTDQDPGKKVPRYLREGGASPVVITDSKPARKGSTPS